MKNVSLGSKQEKMGEFVVEVPAGVKAGERFAASVGNGRKVTVRIFYFLYF